MTGPTHLLSPLHFHILSGRSHWVAKIGRNLTSSKNSYTTVETGLTKSFYLFIGIHFPSKGRIKTVSKFPGFHPWCMEVQALIPWCDGYVLNVFDWDWEIRSTSTSIMFSKSPFLVIVFHSLTTLLKPDSTKEVTKSTPSLLHLGSPSRCPLGESHERTLCVPLSEIQYCLYVSGTHRPSSLRLFPVLTLVLRRDGSIHSSGNSVSRGVLLWPDPREIFPRRVIMIDTPFYSHSFYWGVFPPEGSGPPAPPTDILPSTVTYKGLHLARTFGCFLHGSSFSGPLGGHGLKLLWTVSEKVFSGKGVGPHFLSLRIGHLTLHDRFVPLFFCYPKGLNFGKFRSRLPSRFNGFSNVKNNNETRPDSLCFA